MQSVKRLHGIAFSCSLQTVAAFAIVPEIVPEDLFPGFDAKSLVKNYFCNKIIVVWHYWIL